MPQLLARHDGHRDVQPLRGSFTQIVGNSTAMRTAIALARHVADSPLTTVLLEGETGTGKELFARGIHNAGASRAEPFVGISCAAIPENLLESELFGHERGAFTGARDRKPGLFEHAGSGTIFLDEAHQLPMSLQPKLLRVLENRAFRRLGGTQELEVRCRVVAGTNAALDRAVTSGQFRGDLYYRLNVFRIELPPLRERREDIVPLAEHFLRQIAARSGARPKILSDRAKALLSRHDWRGNVREIRNVVERASILAANSVIQPAHLQMQRREIVSAADADGMIGSIAVPRGGKSIRDAEAELIRLTMILTAGNLSAAARLLGISRPTLSRKMRLSGLTRRSLITPS